MRRVKVDYLPEARRDLESIYETVLWASRSEATASLFQKRIRNRCQRIGNVPHGGRPRDDLEAGLRTVPFEHSAIIAYKVESDCVLVVNIFYGGRDFEAFYLDTPIEDDGLQ
jgi:toxin ParE1/3/4